MIPLSQLNGSQVFVNPHYILRCWKDEDANISSTTVLFSDGARTTVSETPDEIVALIDGLQQFWRDL